MTQEMRNPGGGPGNREDGHAKLINREVSQRPCASQEVVVATIEKNSRERFEVALRRRAGGCIRVELRVREQNGLREWKDGPLTISIDPELTAQISEAFIQARELAAKSEWARGVAQLEFQAAKERRQR